MYVVALALWQGLVLQTFFMVGKVYLPPTASQEAWTLMSPAKGDPGSPLTMPPGNRRLKPEKKEDIQKEERVPTWRTSSPSVREHVEKNVISEYPRKDGMRSGAAAAAQRFGAMANPGCRNRQKGMRKGQWK